METKKPFLNTMGSQKWIVEKNVFAISRIEEVSPISEETSAGIGISDRGSSSWACRKMCGARK